MPVVAAPAFHYAEHGDRKKYDIVQSVRTLTLLELVATTCDDPSDMLRQVAEQLETNNDACMFATAVCGVLDTASGAYWLANAGHESPVLQRIQRRGLLA